VIDPRNCYELERVRHSACCILDRLKTLEPGPCKPRHSERVDCADLS
jgi:hypothetical protein